MSLPRGPGTDGAGPAVAWGDRSDPRPIVSGPVSDASLKFLESSHREALDALHCEVQLLQQKNSDLSFKLLLTEQMSTDLADARLRIEALERREAELLKSLEAETARADTAVSKATATNQDTALELQQKLDRAAVVEAQLREELKSVESQLQLQSPPKVQYAEYSTSPKSQSGTSLAPSPPRKSPKALGQRLRQHQLFRRASSLAVEQSGSRTNPEGGQLLVGSLPQYPDPVPPIRASAD